MPLPSKKIDSKSTRPPRVCVLGATLGTGNLGVDALGMSMVQGLHEALPDIEVVYQSWDLRRRVTISLGEESVECDPIAIRRKGSLRHRDGLKQIKKLGRFRRWLSARAGSSLPTFSNTLKQLLRCDVILDVSAGDSFADIYGQEVFDYQSQIKLLCLDLGLPLVLMPQTYGPYDSETSAEIAGEIMSRCAMVCTREASGIDEIKKLCGNHSAPQVVRVPDMAFILEPRETNLPENFLRAQSSGATCLALNISGLLYSSRRSFGLQVDYRKLAKALLDWALAIPNSHVLLVPHVVAPTGSPKVKGSRIASSDSNDIAACEHLLAELADPFKQRVDILSEADDPALAKFAISQCEFFVGARMHAFIGAISQAVPGALLAYSKKADGLASLLGISDSIVDPRDASIEDCIQNVDSLYQQRVNTQQLLHDRVPLAKEELRRFFRDELVPLILGDLATVPAPHIQQNTTRSNPRQTKVST